MNFSVLMSVYFGETRVRFERCVNSILGSTILPFEIVIVTDGVQNEGVNGYLEYLKQNTIFKIIGYEQNMGLGYALNFGLSHVNCEYVMRMDTDDVVLPYRFERQLKFMELHGLDLCSGHIQEFADIDSGVSLGKRKVPLGTIQINRRYPWRSPFNHMAVCFRKSAILKIGGYEVVDLYEDFYLWWKAYRVLKYDNIDEILVHATFDLSQVERRTGYSIFKRELRFQLKCFELHGKIVFLGIGLFRVLSRLFPTRTMKSLYTKYLRE